MAWQTYALELKSITLERIALGRERALLRAAHAQWVADPSCVPLREGWGEVARWAVTKAGSRRRRGYNVDSSWTEAALSRWLVPHGRSAS